MLQNGFLTQHIIYTEMTIQINNRTPLLHLSAAIFTKLWCLVTAVLFGCVSQGENNVQLDQDWNLGPSEYCIAARPTATLTPSPLISEHV
jgi:hypothetical protein